MRSRNDGSSETERADIVIIGAGAAGLMCAAQLDLRQAGRAGRPAVGLLLESGPQAGRKLLVSGSGQCNFTHAGPMREFVRHYGDHGRLIRRCLYRFGNRQTVDFFEQNGLPTREREDGKIFPACMQAQAVRDLLLQKCRENGWQLRTGFRVTELAESGGSSGAESVRSSGTKSSGSSDAENGDCCGTESSVCRSWLINGRLRADHLVAAAGGCSYPGLGSDGAFADCLAGLGLALTERRPALTPIFVEDYPFADCAGISFETAEARLHPCAAAPFPANDGNIGSRLSEKKRDKNSRTARKASGPLLLTHRGFSGPVILELSRYAAPGARLELVFWNGEEADCRGVHRGLAHYLAEQTGLPRRFLARVIDLAGGDPAVSAASASGRLVRKTFALLRGMPFRISGLGGWKEAMVTAGGIDLGEVDLSTMECRAHPGLCLIGEILDVDGDTGGYNLQFAFSSAAAAAAALRQKLQNGQR
ncbi:MAG: NAD(P)/FAD-dependent oxidoreductase [Anaerovoracaceae bacterium]